MTGNKIFVQLTTGVTAPMHPGILWLKLSDRNLGDFGQLLRFERNLFFEFLSRHRVPSKCSARGPSSTSRHPSTPSTRRHLQLPAEERGRTLYTPHACRRPW